MDLVIELSKTITGFIDLSMELLNISSGWVDLG